MLEDYFQYLEILENNSFVAYFVGGCVRDLLLGLAITDIDIATNARPAKLKELFFSFPNSDYALKYGSLRIKGDYPCQITTFRREGDYLDYRHPDSIEYIDDIQEDARRRDFTVNALYLDKRGKIIDFFDGQKDLNQSIIKMIGDPNLRLVEDPLRIIRALRLADTLDFTLDYSLEKAIKENLGLIIQINEDKYNEEMKKYSQRKHYFNEYLSIK